MRPDQISQAIAKARVGVDVTAFARRSLAALDASISLSDETKKMLDSAKLSPAITGQVPKLPRSISATVSDDMARATGTIPKSFAAGSFTLSEGPKRALDSFMQGQGAVGQIPDMASIKETIPKSLVASIALSDETKKMLDSAKLSPAITGQVPKLPRTVIGRMPPLVGASAERVPVVVPLGELSGDAEAVAQLPELRSRLLPEEVGEVVATGLARADREAVMMLFTDTGLEDARLHLEAVEERLVHGTKPAHLHAALSASLLLRELADWFFPARKGEFWLSRFKTRHPLDAQFVSNRLAAFVDSRIRSQLSTREHRLFQATLDAVVDWAGEGHHVVRDPRRSARTFRQLLEVLATVARAYSATDD